MKKIILLFVFFFTVGISFGADLVDDFPNVIKESIADIVADSRDFKRINDGEQRLQAICNMLGHPDYAEQRLKAEIQLVAALKETDNAAAYPWIVRQLGRIGSAVAVPALADKLDVSRPEAKNYASLDLFDEIVAALALIPDKEAGDYVRKILPDVFNPRRKIALIQTLAYRCEPESVDTLSNVLLGSGEIKKLSAIEQQREITDRIIRERLERIQNNQPGNQTLEDRLKQELDREFMSELASDFADPLRRLPLDKQVSYFAIQAMGKIGTKLAAEKLESHKIDSDRDDVWMFGGAMITCANKLAQSGNLVQAISIFQDLSLSRDGVGVRCAANRGMLNVSTQSDDLGFVVFLLKAGPERKEVLQAALSFLWDIEEKIDGKITEDDFNSLPLDMKIAVLNILGQKHDETALSLLGSVLDSPDEPEALQAAAYGSLAGVGNKNSIPQLLEKLNSNGVISHAVRSGLANSTIEGLDEAIAAAVAKTTNNIAKNNLLTLAGERKCQIFVPLFIGILSDVDDRTTRDIAVRSIGETGTVNDILKICEAILASPRGERRTDLERAAQKICERNFDREQREIGRAHV